MPVIKVRGIGVCARQHKVTEVACYQPLGRTLLGYTKEVRRPHQCPRVCKKKTKNHEVADGVSLAMLQ